MKIRFRKRKRNRKRKRITAAAAVIVSVCMCILVGDFIREDSLLDTVLRQAKSEAYMKMLKSAAPSLFYEEQKKESLKRLMDLVFQTVPVYGYVTDAQEYTTQSESEISYETVIAREAADENYVDDKTGKVISSEDTEPAKPTEEPPVPKQEPDAGKSEQTETAANASFVPNDTPVVTYSKEKLNDFDYLIQNFYVVDRTTTINSSQLNAADLLSRSMKLTHGADAPQILIYHTHSQERFADSVPGDKNTSIVGVGDYLYQLLTGYGLNVMHHTGEYDVDTRDDAYAKAGPVIEQILKENPSIEVVIDLHRDGVAEGTRLVTDVQGKQTASIMFFNGLSRTTANGDIAYLPNPYIQDNLAFSLQMQIAAAKLYPGFTRHIYLKSYRYNLHLKPKSLLIEAGAQTNTVGEMRNAMEALAKVLNECINK